MRADEPYFLFVRVLVRVRESGVSNSSVTNVTLSMDLVGWI
jgi:hypothetical protein